MMIISHDLSVLADLCDRIAVMYAGRVVEYGPAGEVFGEPLHPYAAPCRRPSPRSVTRPRATPRPVCRATRRTPPLRPVRVRAALPLSRDGMRGGRAGAPPVTGAGRAGRLHPGR